jgi:hypothetical protein
MLNLANKLIYYPVLLILVFSTFSVNGAEVKNAPTTNIPNVDFEVATKQQNGSQIDQSIHIFKLYCGLGECQLEQFSLNECEPVEAINRSFALKTQGWTTWAGNLKVKIVSSNTLEVTVFQTTHHGFPARISFSYFPELPFSKRVVAFVTKDFFNLNSYPELTTVEYVPIVGLNHVEPINCSIMVQGINP